jgi:beta-galactosidase/beta-glucuronidase
MKQLKLQMGLLLVAAFMSVLNLQAQKKSPAVAASTETAIQYLSGHGSDDAVEWDFFCTDGRNSGKWTKIKVPSCWELQGFGTYQYGMPFYGKADPPGVAKEQGKYKYKFKLPKEWEGRVVRIVFDGVMTDCSADINGRRCIKLHQGSFYRFKTDVSDRVFFGDKENLLEVTVSKESANSSVNMAERRADFWNFGGIFRPVFVEALPVQNIERTAIDAKADGSFAADVYLGSSQDSDFKVVAQLTDKEGKNVGKAIEVPVRGGSDRVKIEGTFSGIKTWSPETPNLYNMTFSLVQGNVVRHTVKERIGFRTIEVREHDGLYINGQKVLMKGVNRHSFRPETGRTLSKKDNYDDVKLMKDMNMNAVRLSHYPSDPEFLDACDELGLYVMVELCGWHGNYDTPTGKKLVYEMVTRDLNHPCVTFWSNGNEGGFNFDLDGEFAPLDPQKRPVIHPWANFSGFETMHYRSYGESQEYMRKPEIFMPTEFLHGLYDGGHGAGLYDYWEMMRKHPRSAGGFLWSFADEGVVRTDQNNRIDNQGSYAPDGIVGPHFEKEGSFFTIRQVWSPVQVNVASLSENFNGVLPVENRYDFINLKNCKFVWKLAKLPYLKEKQVVASGEIASPDVAAHASGELKINLPADWRKADVLYLTATDPFGKEIWTWNWSWKKPTDFFSFAGQKGSVSAREEGDNLIVKTTSDELTFSKKSGELVKVLHDGKAVSFGKGPRFTAARRGDRSMDVFYNHDDKDAKSKERIYKDISGNDKLTAFTFKATADSVTVDATYFGNLQKTHWAISADGNIRVDYQYDYEGEVELMGVKFDYPEEMVVSKQWLGNGPYRVWQNRVHGTLLDSWQRDYNDPIPGESFEYPEFKGYFANWKWVNFTTKEGNFALGNDDPDSYLGVFTPRDGRDAQLFTLPQTGISVLKVIPAIRNKVNSTDLIGPSSWAKWVSGAQKGSIYLKFGK